MLSACDKVIGNNRAPLKTIAIMKHDDLDDIIKIKSFHKAIAMWAADCSEHVLGYFERNVRNNTRPREAIEAARAWARGESGVKEARKAAFAAHAAAREISLAAHSDACEIALAAHSERYPS